MGYYRIYLVNCDHPILFTAISLKHIARYFNKGEIERAEKYFVHKNTYLEIYNKEKRRNLLQICK
jgi:hypothetical protein